MPTPLTTLIDELQQRAQTCERAAEDATEEALTDEASARDKHARNALTWRIKSEVWREAEAVARAVLEGRPNGMRTGARHH